MRGQRETTHTHIIHIHAGTDVHTHTHRVVNMLTHTVATPAGRDSSEIADLLLLMRRERETFTVL